MLPIYIFGINLIISYNLPGLFHVVIDVYIILTFTLVTLEFDYLLYVDITTPIIDAVII